MQMRSALHSIGSSRYAVLFRIARLAASTTNRSVCQRGFSFGTITGTFGGHLGNFLSVHEFNSTPRTACVQASACTGCLACRVLITYAGWHSTQVLTVHSGDVLYTFDRYCLFSTPCLRHRRCGSRISLSY